MKISKERKISKKLLALLLVITMLVLVSACVPAEGTQPAEQAGGAAASDAAGLEAVPRNRTLIMAGLGGEHPGGFTDVELFNPYVPGTSRSGMYQAGTEGLFYYNMIGDEFTPWLATDFAYNDDFTEVTVSIREGAKWSDGEAFDANAVHIFNEAENRLHFQRTLLNVLMGEGGIK